MMKITEHEGRKYLRQVRCLVSGVSASIDVYSVLKAFGVTCPARAHGIKKLLCAGVRSKGSEIEDLQGALAAVSRAVEMQHERDTA